MDDLAKVLAERHQVIGDIVTDLASGRFEEVARRSNYRRLSGSEIGQAIHSYGRELIPLPPEAFSLIDFVSVRGSNPPQWSVVVPLFTKEEGRSDLSLELSLRRLAPHAYTFEIDGIHVL